MFNATPWLERGPPYQDRVKIQEFMLSHTNPFKITFPEKFFNCSEPSCASVRIHSALEAITLLPDNNKSADGHPNNWTETFDSEFPWDTFRVNANATLIEYAILNETEELYNCNVYGYPFNAFKVCLKDYWENHIIVCEDSFLKSILTSSCMDLCRYNHFHVFHQPNMDERDHPLY